MEQSDSGEVGVLTHLKSIRSAPQHAIAFGRARWEGEAVCELAHIENALTRHARAIFHI